MKQRRERDCSTALVCDPFEGRRTKARSSPRSGREERRSSLRERGEKRGSHGAKLRGKEAERKALGGRNPISSSSCKGGRSFSHGSGAALGEGRR